MKEYTHYLLRMASESVNTLKPLQLIITPNLRLMKTFNLSVVVVIKWYQSTDASQSCKYFKTKRDVV